jgi:arylsulfatase A-like enzyme
MALLSGRMPHPFGGQKNLPDVAKDLQDYNDKGIPESETLVSTVLQDAGYYTGCLGKWHLGTAAAFHPNARLAGASFPSDKLLDGRDVWDDFLAGRNPHDGDTMFWLRHHGGKSEVAIRRGDLKAYRKGFGTWKIYDVSADVGDSKDLSSRHPEVLSSRIVEGAAWGETHLEPQWHDTKAGLDRWIESKMPRYEETFSPQVGRR